MVNQEQALILDDILVNGDTLVPFGGEAPDLALMGRVRNVLLVNGETSYSLSAHTRARRAVFPRGCRELAYEQRFVPGRIAARDCAHQSAALRTNSTVSREINGYPRYFAKPPGEESHAHWADERASTRQVLDPG